MAEAKENTDSDVVVLPACTCAICNEDYLTTNDAAALVCGHIFHTECINSWKISRRTQPHECFPCPVCRTPGKKSLKLFFDLNVDEISYSIYKTAAANQETRNRQVLKDSLSTSAFLLRSLENANGQKKQLKDTLSTIVQHVAAVESAKEEFQKKTEDLSFEQELRIKCLKSYIKKQSMARKVLKVFKKSDLKKKSTENWNTKTDLAKKTKAALTQIALTARRDCDELISKIELALNGKLEEADVLSSDEELDPYFQFRKRELDSSFYDPEPAEPPPSTVDDHYFKPSFGEYRLEQYAKRSRIDPTDGAQTDNDDDDDDVVYVSGTIPAPIGYRQTHFGVLPSAMLPNPWLTNASRNTTGYSNIEPSTSGLSNARTSVPRRSDAQPSTSGVSSARTSVPRGSDAQPSTSGLVNARTSVTTWSDAEPSISGLCNTRTSVPSDDSSNTPTPTIRWSSPDPPYYEDSSDESTSQRAQLLTNEEAPSAPTVVNFDSEGAMPNEVLKMAFRIKNPRRRDDHWFRKQ